MFNNKISYAALMLSVGVGLYSCGGDSSSEPTIEVPFSLGVSDAFVDDAEAVVITIAEIRLIPFDSNDDDDDDDDDDRETITINQFNGADTVSLNLLDYTGNEQLTIVSEDDEIEVPVGSYLMELIVIDSGSYVILIDDPAECVVDEDDMSMAEGDGCYDIKVPSSRLRLGDFDVVLGAVESSAGPAYTVEFDLTKSLVLRGNDPSKNGFIIKPHGVRVTSSSSSGHIEGDVDLVGIMEIESSVDPLCTGVDHTVYLYQGDQTGNPELLADNFDAEDVGFNAADLPAGAISPFASTKVVMDDEDDDDVGIDELVEYEYEFGFVPNGNNLGGNVDPEDAIYTVAFACNVGSEELKDNPVTYDGLTIANPKGQLAVVTVLTGEVVELNFPLGFKDDDDD